MQYRKVTYATCVHATEQEGAEGDDPNADEQQTAVAPPNDAP
jgi:hypothetical protein